MKIPKEFLHGVDLGHLPEKHHFAHSYCFFLHDLIVQTIVEGEKADIFNIHVSDETGELIKAIKGKGGAELIGHLEANGHQDKVLALFYKQIFAGMLSDFGHFIYEALSCSKKGKLTVAYALLRKPFKDNLLYLEWLLANPADLLINFKDGNVDELALDRNPEKRKLIISEAMQRTGGTYWSTPEAIFELRFDKKSESSFEAIWQRANHLITLVPHYKTEPTNFNFIFSQADSRESQWDFLYSFLPVLLVHSYRIIETLVKGFAIRANEANDVTDLRVLCGFLLWFQDTWGTEESSEQLRQIIEQIGLSRLPCPKCDTYITFDDENIAAFYGVGSLVCRNCAKLIDLVNNQAESQ